MLLFISIVVSIFIHGMIGRSIGQPSDYERYDREKKVYHADPHREDHAPLGFVLGALLGPLGWILTWMYCRLETQNNTLLARLPEVPKIKETA